MSKTPLHLGNITYVANEKIIDTLNRNKLVYFYTIKKTTPGSNRKRQIVYIGKSSIGNPYGPHKEIFGWFTSFLTGEENRKKLLEMNAPDNFSIYIIEVSDNIDLLRFEQAFIKVFDKKYDKPILNNRVTKEEIESLLQNSGFTEQDLECIIERIEMDNMD